MFMRSVFFSLIALSMVLASCASMPAASQKASKVEVEANPMLSVIPEGMDVDGSLDLGKFTASKVENVIRAGDTTHVDVYGFKDLSESYSVSRNGNIAVPLLGDVYVAGMTRLEMKDKLTTLYSADLLQDPIIEVEVASKSLGSIIVSGAVRSPGIFNINEVITVGTAVAMAKGLEEEALSDELYVIREVAGERTIYSVDLDAIQLLGAPDPQIIPGDYIFVRNDDSIDYYSALLKSLPLISIFSLLTR